MGQGCCLALHLSHNSPDYFHFNDDLPPLELIRYCIKTDPLKPLLVILVALETTNICKIKPYLTRENSHDH